MKAEKQTTRTCPLCGQIYIGYPALSRADNETPSFVRIAALVKHCRGWGLMPMSRIKS